MEQWTGIEKLEKPLFLVAGFPLSQRLACTVAPSVFLTFCHRRQTAWEEPGSRAEQKLHVCITHGTFLPLPLMHKATWPLCDLIETPEATLRGVQFRVGTQMPKGGGVPPLRSKVSLCEFR